MHRGCFVWTPKPPLAGRRTPRPGPVRVCVCSSFLAGSGGPASRALFGAPPLFLWPLCLSALLGPLRAWVAPFLVLCLPSPCFTSPPFSSFVSFFRRAPPLSLAFFGLRPRVPWALSLCFSVLPPPGLWFFFFLCAPFVSGFLWFPAPGALGLGAVCCLFCWPPASWLSVLSRLVCVSHPAVGCSLVVAAPPPPFRVSWFSSLPFEARFFFSLCASVVSGFRWFPAPGALGLGAVGCFFLLASRFSALRALSPRLCVPPRRWLLSGGCCPPHPLSVALFSSLGAPFFVFSFALSFRAPVVLAPAVSGFLWFPAPDALGLGAVCCLFWWPPASRLAVRSRLFCISRLADGCSLVVAAPPPLCVSRFSLLPLGARFFLCAPVVSGFRSFPALAALGLGAVCCLFCWPPASRLAVRCRLFCVSRLAVGCYLVFAVPPPPFVSRGFRRCLLVLGFFFVVRPLCLRLFLVSGPGCPGPWRCVLFVPRAAGCGVPCFASSGVVSCGAAVCGVFCAVPGVVWRACVWLGSCAVLWCVLLCCFCCALLSCVAALSAGFFFVVPCLSVVLRAVSVSVLCLCGAVPVCLRRCSLCVALLPLRGWLVFCVVVCCVCVFAVGPGCPLLSPVGSWCRVSMVCCGVSLSAVLRRVAACRAAWCCVVVRCVVSFCSAWCCRPLCRVLGRCPSSCGPVSSALCFVLSRRAVCVLLWCVAAWCCALCRVRPGVSCCAFPVLSALCGVAVLPCSPLVPCSPVLCPVVLCCCVVLWCPVLLPCLFGFSYL